MGEPTLHLSLPVDDLGAARDFYERGLGCRIGRVRERWFDVWFFGLQLTLHLSPAEVAALTDQGSRHFGVVLDDETAFWALVERTRSQGIDWLTEPVRHDAAELSGKVGGKLADPAGNVIEIKHYADPTAYRGGGRRTT
jgi:extradiol dioxygenase family protein